MTSEQLLVFTRTAGFRHDSIPEGIAAFRDLGAEQGRPVLATEDPAELAAALPGSAAVVFLSTTGEVLTDAARDALRAHQEAGGGFLGVHSASGTEYDWPWYGELVGARFDGHPALQPGVVRVTDHGHPATAHLPHRWRFTDEWYHFTAGPSGRVRVLATADESTYTGGRMGEDHPLVWCHEHTGGRAFYTALGHTAEAYTDPDFRAHLRGALAWVTEAAGKA